MIQANQKQDTFALKTQGIYKSFGHVEALTDVCVNIPENKISALVGDNGAGKSTLIKILSGVLKPDRGTIDIAGQSCRFLTPAQAIQKGLVTVFQDLSLVNCRDVVSNIFLGHELIKGKFFINRRQMEREAANLLEYLNIDIPSLRTNVGNLSGGQRQAIAIARAIKQGGKVLILDEPTAAMGVKETGQIIKLISELRGKGYTILLISHNILHVFALCDAINVMKKGRLITQVAKERTNPDEIIQLITGLEKEDACVV